jgi:amidase
MNPKAPLRSLLVAFAASALLAASAHAATLDIDNATIADVDAALASGKVTSEQLVNLYLKRIAAYDKQGPDINAIILLNPKALEQARALDAERKAKGPRSRLHGIPIFLKDNYNTFDMPTTAGSQLLDGSIPPSDAFVVKKLRDAGAIILAKTNLSEFAGCCSGGGIAAVPNGFSSQGGQTRNPHDLTKGPSGSSGGTGAGIAGSFAQFGLGTDTGGSIRGPSSANGIVGLKPTRGLMSRAGIVPLALSFDTGGPMARSVYDIAASLSVMAGVDPADSATQAGAGKAESDYTKFLKKGALKGARIGVARDFFKQNAETDRVMEAAIAKLKELGATVIDPVNYPEYVLQARQPLLTMVMNSEFKAQIATYLSTLKPGYPRTLTELVAKASDPAIGYRSPEKRDGMKHVDETASDPSDPLFITARDQGLALIRANVEDLFAKYKLDALVYPTSPRPATPIERSPPGSPPPGGGSATGIANISGFPDLIVPAGMTNDGLPVTISFFGLAWSEPKLLAYGYDFEQATKARVLPKYTPALPSDVIKY